MTIKALGCCVCIWDQNRDLMFLMTIAGTAGLCLLFFALRFSGSAAPASLLQLLQDLRPGSGQQCRLTQQCRFTQHSQLVTCVNNALNDKLLTLR